MADVTRIVRHDAYEAMGSAYQCVQVATLDAALRGHGVADAALRQKICETFLFEMGVVHDQCWLRPSPDAEPVYPLLCFSERLLKTGTPIEKLGPIYAPSPMFAFREYAHGNASLVFEDDPDGDVETGLAPDD